MLTPTIRAHVRAAARLRGFASAASPTSLAAAVTAAPRDALALLAPQQGISYTYGELDEKARCLASGLEDVGYKSGSVAISDIPNVAENLLLQIALSHLGAAVCTPPKDDAMLASLGEKFDIKGVICVDGSAPPLSKPDALPLVYLGLADGCRPTAGSVEFGQLLAHCPPRGSTPASTPANVLGIYGGAPLTHATALELGHAAAMQLGISPADRVCCSVTLMHAFGIGSAVSSALVSGASVVLPAVGGIKGCGDPNQRAAVTLEVLGSTQASVLFGDSHTLKALYQCPPPSAGQLQLRTGVVKIGSGSTFLDGVSEIPAKGDAPPTPLEYAGVKFFAMGKRA